LAGEVVKVRGLIRVKNLMEHACRDLGHSLPEATAILVFILPESSDFGVI